MVQKVLKQARQAQRFKISIHISYKQLRFLQQSMSGNLLDSSSSMGTQKEPTANKPHFMSLEYYQRFFDIDEDMVCSFWQFYYYYYFSNLPRWSIAF
jgi:hypothetical protein